MCLILFAYDKHPNYRLIMAANRDEYHHRSTAPALFWEDETDVLAGRDLEELGTWMGVSKKGRFAVLTNYRETTFIKNARSRGELVREYLTTKNRPYEFLLGVQNKQHLYNGFNLLAGDLTDLYYLSNRHHEIIKLKPGIYGLSNHLLDTEWPKVKRGKSLLKECMNQDRIDPDCFFHFLRDDWQPEDYELPDTGVGLEKERFLAPLFIKGKIYGTKTSTLLMINRENQVYYAERTFNPEKTENPFERAYHFSLEEDKE